jgi:hypothetical protein
MVEASEHRKRNDLSGGQVGEIHEGCARGHKLAARVV